MTVPCLSVRDIDGKVCFRWKQSTVNNIIIPTYNNYYTFGLNENINTDYDGALRLDDLSNMVT